MAPSLEYWGAIPVNPAVPKTLVGTCEMIAHEAAHNALFGLSPRQFFVWNSDEERHKSPLRDDPRRLDGIHHAVFVSARMHFAVTEIIRSGRLGAEQVDAARQSLAIDLRLFVEGKAVLEAHARFPPEGRAILDAAAAHVAA
ncbi:MAG: HEXXH motif-containing putative peptide modification protein [Bauldia sp.]